MRRKTVAVKIDSVDVDCSQCEAFVQDPCALIDERIDASLNDFLRRDFALLDSLLTAPTAHQLSDLGIGNLTALFVVAIPARACLLPITTHFAESVFGKRLTHAGLLEMAVLFANAPANIEPGEIRHG